MSADTLHLKGLPTDEVLADARRAHAVHGVQYPGDVGVFVRDDDLPCGDVVGGHVAAWRCTQEAVGVTVYPVAHDPAADPADRRYVADARRWDPEMGRYVQTDVLVGGATLSELATVVTGALRRASDREMHALDALEDYADALGDTDWWGDPDA